MTNRCKELSDHIHQYLQHFITMITFFTRHSVALLFVLCFANQIVAQQQTPLDIALRYMEQYHSRWQLDAKDIANMAVSDQYASRHNGVTHIYFLQQYAGIPVYDAIAGVHVTKNGKIGFATSRFVPQLATKINTTTPTLSAEQAIFRAVAHLELSGKAAPVLQERTEQGTWVFESSAISKWPIKVRLVYQLISDEVVRLAWDLGIYDTDSPDYWSVRIDALTGALLDKQNQTLHCNFGDNHLHEPTCAEQSAIALASFQSVRSALLQQFEQRQQNLEMPVDNAQYRVFPVPVESPVHGERVLVVNPADPIASPFGWHDTNGIPGPEFTITRGNNVHAFVDADNSDVSKGDEPNGGPGLTFDFPFNPDADPADNRDAATVQLFFWNNIMHDFAYAYGFDEVSGNFQENNYGRGGQDKDYVMAHAQDGGGTNNANFLPLADGNNGVMQMYIWRTSQDVLRIDEPASIAGGYAGGLAVFGPTIGRTPITGRLVAARDGSDAPSLVCSNIVNTAEVSGNIALIDRGECTFQSKTLRAQAAGAIAVIVCNYEDATLTMASDGIGTPTIPAIILSSSNCQKIKAVLDQNITVSLQANLLDGTMDNGIIAHEYGHGISTRLTGGPSASGCLNNNEQMGEGWSDFFTLVTSVLPDETGREARGIGSFVTINAPGGRGIRRFPYSTDMSINPQVHYDIIGTTSPHNLGEVWAATLWDLYWKMAEVYGYDDDLYYGQGGNNKALQLIMDGMKLQPCRPGFIDGRDAILAADLINNDGENQCLIWEVFARRGLGYRADQGSPNDRNDAKQAFDVEPTCIQTLKISKTSTPLIEAGDEIVFTFSIANHKPTAVTDVTITDVLPQGLTFIAGSAVGGTARVENGTVILDIGVMQASEERTLRYRAASSFANRSLRTFFDDAESGGSNWRTNSVRGTNAWSIRNNTSNNRIAYSGQRAWFVPSTRNANDQTLTLAQARLISGAKPVLRFYHNYDIRPGLDGGLLQISTDGGDTWSFIDSLIFRNEYRGRIARATFDIPNIEAWWGNSNGYVASYADLSAFIGQEVLLRFRFGTQAKAETVTNVGTGWYLDNIEFMEMFNYESEACITSAQGDLVCVMVDERGAIVETSNEVTATSDRDASGFIQVFPNPTKGLANIAINHTQTEQVYIELLAMDGRVLRGQQDMLQPGYQLIPVNLSGLHAGAYVVRVRTTSQTMIEKLIIR